MQKDSKQIGTSMEVSVLMIEHEGNFVGKGLIGFELCSINDAYVLSSILVHISF